jgi:hypothetical protein
VGKGAASGKSEAPNRPRFSARRLNIRFVFLHQNAA